MMNSDEDRSIAIPIDVILCFFRFVEALWVKGI